MKLFRHIATTALITVGAFSAVTYTACTKTTDQPNAKFVGTYNATETCTPPLSGTGWVSHITASSLSGDQIVIDNFGASGSSINATVSSSGSITLTTTIISGNTVSGSGSISGTTVTITYTLTPGGYTCTQTMLRQ